MAGSSVQWLRDSLGIIKEASEIGKLASSVEDTGGVFFVTVRSLPTVHKYRVDDDRLW